MKISVGYRLICNETCENMIIPHQMLSLRSITIIISLIHSAYVLSVNPRENISGDKFMKICLGYRLICDENLCNYGYILFKVIASLNYNFHQFDSLSWRINNNRSRTKCYKRQIDEDQIWLPADM